MWAIAEIFFGEIILNIIILFYIPKNDFFKSNYFNNEFLCINYERIDKNLTNVIYYNITEKLSVKLNYSLKLNKASFWFIIAIIIISLIIIIIFPLLAKDGIKEGYSFVIIIGFIGLKIAIVFIAWSINLAIYVNIKKIRKKEDDIGFTNEIRKGIIIVIILLSGHLIGFVLEAILLFFRELDINDKESLIIYLKKKIKNLEEVNRNNIINNGRTKDIRSDTSTNDGKIKQSEREIIHKDNKINELLEEIRLKDKKIKELNSYNTYQLKKSEKLLSIIFVTSNQKILYSLVCKNTDIFANVEQELYKIFPEYKEKENKFLIKGRKGREIYKNKTIDENTIKNSDIIIVEQIK